MQSQLLREVGTYHFKMIPSLKSLQVNPCNLSRREHGSWDLPLHTGPKFKSQVTFRSILAISTVESMEVGTYHFTKVPTVKSLEVNPCNPNCREHGSWDPSTSYRSQDPSLESLEVNMCNPNRREHESSDLPLHTSPKSQVPRLKFHLR